MDLDNIWNSFLEKIKLQISDIAYETWFKETKLINLDNDTATVLVPFHMHKKSLSENYNDIITFNCGHKCHYECCVFLNKEISCRICHEYEKENETIYRGEIEIKLPEKVPENRKKSFHKKSNISRKNAKIDRDKMKKLKLINDINEGFFSISKIFEGN